MLTVSWPSTLRTGPWCNGSTLACPATRCGFESRRVHGSPGLVGKLTGVFGQAGPLRNVDFQTSDDDNYCRSWTGYARVGNGPGFAFWTESLLPAGCATERTSAPTKCTICQQKKGAALLSQNGPWRSPPGRRENSYIEGGAGFAVALGAAAGACGFSPAVFVMRRTLTRRFAARPSRVLLSSTGLSLPNPIT